MRPASQQCLPQVVSRIASTVLLVITLAQAASAELYLNELFLDPGGDGLDTRDEYIELRGTPGMSLESHYLIFVENEGDIGFTGSAGNIEGIFTLGRGAKSNGEPIYAEPYTIGENGFLTIRMKDTLYSAPAPGTTDLVNTGSGEGFGSDSGSTIRFSDQGGQGITENSGSTVMLIRNDGDPFLNQPFLGLDLDQGNNGLDSPETSQFGWGNAWEIVDSIGYFGENGEAGWGHLYGKINFGQEIPGEPLSASEGGVFNPDTGQFEFVPNIEEGAVYVGVGYEIELLARWGNSTGQTADDWHVSNLTDEPASGSAGVRPGSPAVIDYRQSGDPHPVDDGDPSTPAMQPSFVESNKGVPYGTKLTTTLGAPNYMTGDFNGDGVVDAADYTVWRDSFGRIGSETIDLAADPNHDFIVDAADYALWKANFGGPISTNDVPNAYVGGSGFVTSIASHHVPEPSSLALVALAALPVTAFRRRNNSSLRKGGRVKAPFLRTY